MMRRHPLPGRWLVADWRLGDALWPAARRLPRGSGILFLYLDMGKAERSKLLAALGRLARRRGLVIADEQAGQAARVHHARELRRALAAGVPMLFLSPIFPTRSHPGWQPLPRMRAAALANSSPVPVIALGGMNLRRFRQVQRLGFSGWAGIDAYGH